MSFLPKGLEPGEPTMLVPEENTSYKTPTGQGANYKMTDNEFREVEALKTRNFATGGKLIKNKQQSQKFTDKYMSELSRRSKNVGSGEFKVDRGGKPRIPVTKSSVRTNFPNLGLAPYMKNYKEGFSNWKEEVGYEGKDEVKKLYEDDMKGMSVKSGHKRPTEKGAGMTAKGVAAYRRRNPGSKLKTAVTGKVKKGSKDAKRRKSYCARSAGQMKKFPKAAKDPNSRLRQARRRWKC